MAIHNPKNHSKKKFWLLTVLKTVVLTSLAVGTIFLLIYIITLIA